MRLAIWLVVEVFSRWSVTDRSMEDLAVFFDISRSMLASLVTLESSWRHLWRWLLSRVVLLVKCCLVSFLHSKMASLWSFTRVVEHCFISATDCLMSLSRILWVMESLSMVDSWCWILLFRVLSKVESWSLMSWASLCSMPLLMRVRAAVVLFWWESMVRWGSMLLRLVFVYVLSVVVLVLSALRMVFALLMRTSRAHAVEVAVLSSSRDFSSFSELESRRRLVALRSLSRVLILDSSRWMVVVWSWLVCVWSSSSLELHLASLVVMALSMALLMRIWIVSSCGAEWVVGVLLFVLTLSKSWILSAKLSESDSSSVSNFLNCLSNLAI